MIITREQVALLKTFRCERLSLSSESRQCASQIVSKRGMQLVGYLQHRGNEEDARGETAYYIIRNSDNLPLAFFSLKCGLLFAPSRIDSIEDDVEREQSLIDALDNGKDETDPTSVALFQYAENLAVKHNCTIDQMIENMKQQAHFRKRNAIKYKVQYHDDEKTEANKPIYRVDITFPGVELVHFCTNDNAKDYWKEQIMNHPMGEVLFWWFIMPIIENVQRIVGCQYAYLFAADSSDDRTLINYYNVSLKFYAPKEIGTSKPRYDFCCEFLLQEISKLIEYKKEYFEHFNLDADTELV